MISQDVPFSLMQVLLKGQFGDVSCSEKLVLCCLKCVMGSLNKYKK